MKIHSVIQHLLKLADLQSIKGTSNPCLVFFWGFPFCQLGILPFITGRLIVPRTLVVAMATSEFCSSVLSEAVEAAEAAEAAVWDFDESELVVMTAKLKKRKKY